MHAGREEWVPCGQFGISNKSEPSHPRPDMLSQPATGKYTLWRVGKGIRFVCETPTNCGGKGSISGINWPPHQLAVWKIPLSLLKAMSTRAACIQQIWATNTRHRKFTEYLMASYSIRCR